jgi:hypothetical protein
MRFEVACGVNVVRYMSVPRRARKRFGARTGTDGAGASGLLTALHTSAPLSGNFGSLADDCRHRPGCCKLRTRPCRFSAAQGQLDLDGYRAQTEQLCVVGSVGVPFRGK